MSETAVATLIGDLVGSRSSQDRAVLHQHLDAALAEVNDLLHPLRPMWITAGDEYQGMFATVAEAVQATLLVRVRLLPTYDIRHGIGWGTTTMLDGEAGIEDGPGLVGRPRCHRGGGERRGQCRPPLAPDGVRRRGRRRGRGGPRAGQRRARAA